MYELRRAHFEGNKGKPGKSDKGHGTDGKDIRFTVPIGTEIYEVKKSEINSTDRELQFKVKVADLD